MPGLHHSAHRSGSSHQIGRLVLDDVVDVTTFHTDPVNQVETFTAIRNKAVGDLPYPNSTAVGVTWLSGFDFEIKVIARIP